MTDTAPGDPARVNGQPVTVQQAITAAAALLAASRSVVVAGLGTDVAGARASVALARAIGGSLDHMDAGAVFANLDVVRRSGWIVTTPLQVRSRADLVLLVGDGLTQAWPDIVERLALNAPPTLAPPNRKPSSPSWPSRRIVHVCAATSPHGGSGIQDLLTVGEGKPILSTLAALRAIVAGRRTSLNEADAAPLRTLASALTEARFGVAIWSATLLDTLTIEMLCGLIDDLNKKTRFAALPLAPENGAEAVVQALAWTTGLPPRTGFADTAPLHDPWRFDARRLIASGETDAAVWVSAFSPISHPWDDAVPTVALVPPGTAFRTPPAVVFEVGYPGRDHDAMLFDPALGGIAFAAASAPSGIGSVVAVLAGITAALPSC